MGAKVGALPANIKKPGFWQKPGFLGWPILLITLLGLGLRVLRLSFQPLWWDEGYSVWFATHPIGEMLTLTAQDIHPPLYYALLSGWSQLFGAGPEALRLLSVIVGTLTIPAIFLAGRRLIGHRGASLSALLLAINPMHVFYSQELRMYGLVTLLSSGVLASAWRIFAPHRAADESATAWRQYAPYVLLTTAALYTQYYAVFLPIGLTLYALWFWRRDWPSFGRWIGAHVAVAALYLPWVLYAAPKLLPYVAQKVVADADRPLGLALYLGRHLTAFLVGHLEGPLAPYWPLALLLLIPLSLGWWLLRNQRNQPVSLSTCFPVSLFPCFPITLLTTLLTTILLLGWAIGLTYPFFPERGERLLLLALPAFLLLAGAALDGLWRRARGFGLATIALIGVFSGVSIFGFYTVPRYTEDDYRPLIARTIQQGLPEDTVVCVYPWQVGYWRAYDTPDRGADGDPVELDAVLLPRDSWSPATEEALDRALNQGRIWFPAHLSLGAGLETRIESYLSGEAISFANQWYGTGTRLSAWAAVDAGQVTTAPPIHFLLPGGQTLTLARVTAALDPIPAANTVLPISLAWRADEEPSALGVSVRLVDDRKQIWAQHDYEPLGSLSGAAQDAASGITEKPCNTWEAEDRLGLLIPAGTPPGEYAVELAVRLTGGLRPLEAQTEDGKTLGTNTPLFGVTVSPAGRTLSPQHLPIGERKSIDMGDGLRFLGYSTAATTATPGEREKVSLFWQATARPSVNYKAFVQLLDAGDGVIAGWEAPPGAGFPGSQWQPGTLIRTQAEFRPPATLPDGRYRLIGGLFNPEDGTRRRTPAGADSISLGEVRIQGRPHEKTPPQPASPADVAFGDLARLIGYELALPAAGNVPGDMLPLTLFWQATGTADRPFTVFVHLFDISGAIHGFGDSEPGAGQFPTTGWLPDEYLVDRHEIHIASDTPPGPHRIGIGLYDPASGQRLFTSNGDDLVLLDTIVQVY